MSIYIAGGSIGGSSGAVWMATSDGYVISSEDPYDDMPTWDGIQAQNSFLYLGHQGTPSLHKAEFGLKNHNRIRVDTSGIWGYHNDSGVWLSLYGGGGVGGASSLADLSDVVISGTPADNEILGYDTSSSKWINQTAAELEIPLDSIAAPNGDVHFVMAAKHIHWTWTVPDAGADAGAWEMEATGAFSGDLLHLHQHSGNPGATILLHIEVEDTDVVPFHMLTPAQEFSFNNSGLQLGGSGGRITTFDTAALANSDTKVPTNTTVKEYVDSQDHHSIYTLEQHDNTYHSTNYEPTISPKNTAFNKDFGTLGTEVCVGNDSRLSDARTPTSHDNTYHSTNYEVANANIQSHVGSPPADSHHVKYLNSEAVSAVEAAGLTLASTKVIDSADENLNFTFGRVAVGSPASDEAYFAHRDMFSTTSYALKQTSIGQTMINAANTQSIYFKVNDVTKFSVGSSVNAFATLSMNSNKIVDLTAGSASGEAVEYDQLHAEAHDFDTHSGDVDLADLASYAAQGDLIFGGASDWGVLTKGTSGKYLKAGATTISWEDVAALIETGSTFPVSPVDGQTYYDNEDECTYIYSLTAQAWIQIGGSGLAGAGVDDTPFATSWNGVGNIPPSKNAVYDAISDVTYNATTWNNSIIAASRNAIRDKIELDNASSSRHHTQTQAPATYHGVYPAKIMRVGTYTGNGNNNRNIQIGFTPKFVMITVWSGGTGRTFVKSELFGLWYSNYTNDASMYDNTCKIESGGFEVDNGDDNWNRDGYTCDFIAWA